MYKKVMLTLIGVIILGVAYYAVSPVFRTVHSNDVAPQMAHDSSGASSSQDITEAKSASARVLPTAAHPASGSVRVITTKDGTVVRYEDYKTLNGPDLYVYLSNDLEAKDFVNLGTLKATEGNINYPVPVGVDVKKYRYVLTWCKTFGVLFNSADISSIQ